MNTLIIDSGSYSVKFLEGSFQRKSFIVNSVEEVLIEDVRGGDESLSLEAIQQIIIKQYLDQSGFTGKVVTQVPHDLITTRYMDFPTNNKKKAEQMTPFMLDEDLPFSSNDTHILATYFKNAKNQLSAIAQITQNSHFNDFYNMLKTNKTLPSTLTSELSVYQSYVDHQKLGNHFCILDIGHDFTKAYLGHNDRIISNHISSIAGKKIDETIASSYGISEEEARIYKHEEAFFLTNRLLEEVDEDRKNFALLMKKNFIPLVQQLQRWILGYRIKTGFSIEKIYITGGTSNIQNITNFLAEQLEVSVEKLNVAHISKFASNREKSSLTFGYIFGQSLKNKVTPINFLSRQYATGIQNGISLEDTFFNVYRVAIVILLIVASLLVENYVFISNDIKEYTRINIKQLKSDELGIDSKQRKLLRKKPETLEKVLKKKVSTQLADIKSLDISPEKNALVPLSIISDKIKNNENVSMISFESDTFETKASFESESKRELEQLKKLLKTLSVDNLKINDDKENVITVSFSGM